MNGKKRRASTSTTYEFERGKPRESKERLPVLVKPKTDLLDVSLVRGKGSRKRVAKIRTQRKTLEKVSSRFGMSAKEISVMLEEGAVDRAVGHFQKKMLDAVTRIIPLAEKQYKKNPTQSYAYALNALVSQARELIQDIQSTNDRQKLAMILIQEVMMPAFRAVAQSIVDEHYNLRKRIEDKLMPKEKARAADLIDDAGRSIARFASEQYKIVSVRINEMLVK